MFRSGKDGVPEDTFPLSTRRGHWDPFKFPINFLSELSRAEVYVSTAWERRKRIGVGRRDENREVIGFEGDEGGPG